jgi:Fur family ferric uptake transcriptional regulator
MGYLSVCEHDIHFNVDRGGGPVNRRAAARSAPEEVATPVSVPENTPPKPVGELPGRSSRQRSEVLRALVDHSGFISAQTLHAMLNAAGANIGLTTVYRALTTLDAMGRLDCVRQQDGTRLYRHRPSTDHRHYLICRSCGRSEELDAEAFEQWAGQLARRFGFTRLRHTLEVDGICQACADTGAGTDARDGG